MGGDAAEAFTLVFDNPVTDWLSIVLSDPYFVTGIFSSLEAYFYCCCALKLAAEDDFGLEPRSSSSKSAISTACRLFLFMCSSLA